MESTIHFKYFFVIPLIVLLVQCQVSARKGDPDTKNWKSLICEAKQLVESLKSHSFLKCTVNITYDPLECGEYLPSCQIYDSQSLLVSSPLHKSLIQNVNCVSNWPIFTKVHFIASYPNQDFLNMQWRRTFTNFFDKETYSYELRIVLPVKIFNHGMEVVKYEIFSSPLGNNEINVVLFNGVMEEKIDEHDVNIFDSRYFTASDEVIRIPCIFQDPTAVEFSRHNDSIVPIDNTSLSFHPIHGFEINTTLFENWEGTFSCVDKKFPFIREPVIINRQPVVGTLSEFHLSPSDFMNFETPFYLRTDGNESHTHILESYQEILFDLTCRSTTVNVTFLIEDISNPNKSNGVTMMQMKDVIYSFTDKPEKIYTAKVTMSNLKKLEFPYKVYCWDPLNEQIVHEWAVDLYKPKKFTGIILTDTIQCSSISNQLNENDDFIEFYRIPCNDLFACKEVAPFITTVMADFGKPCSDSDHSCKSLPALNKGFLACVITNENHPWRNDFYQDIYFIGFDHKLYVGNGEPPDSAVLKVEVISHTENVIPLPGTYIFSCEAHSFYFEHGIQWFLVYHNETKILAPTENVTDVSEMNGKSNNSLRISSIYLEDGSVHKIMCAAPLLSIANESDRFKWKYSVTNTSLKFAIPPTIISKDSILYFRVGKEAQVIKCEVDGFPLPEISWTTGEGNEILPPLTVTDGPNYKLLQFLVYNESFAGNYVCTAKNQAGIKNETFSVRTFSSHDIWRIVAIVASICIVVAVPPMVFVFRRLNSRSKIQLTDDEIKAFMEGIASDAEENSPLSIPYDEKYDIEEHQFNIDKLKVLGKGAFGIVYHGTLSLDRFSGSAAFKTVRPNCGMEKLKSLLSELKIMIHLGEHENVILLIGAYTKEIKKGIVYIASELCSLGSLEGYLRGNQTKVAHNFSSDSSNEEQTLLEAESQISQIIFSKEKLCTWAFQIANGMEYLAFKHVVHSDLATRNILLDSNEVAKITDFGLSRKMYNYYNYVKDKKKKDPLPWKWMSIESLKTLTFSTQSDIWAYGITLWEIFSLGAVPYPGTSWSAEFLEMLENGLRNPKPKRADSKIYSAMISCWDHEPCERPSFNSLKIFFMEQALKEEIEDELLPSYVTIEAAI